MLCAYFDIPSANNKPPESAPTEQLSVTLENPSPTKIKKRKTCTSSASHKKKAARVKPSEGFVTSRTPLASFKKLHDEIDVPAGVRDSFTDMCEEVEEADVLAEEDKLYEGPWVDGGDENDDDGHSLGNEDATTEGDYPDNDDNDDDIDNDDDDVRSLSCCSTSPRAGGSYPPKKRASVLRYTGIQLDFEEEEGDV